MSRVVFSFTTGAFRSQRLRGALAVTAASITALALGPALAQANVPFQQVTSTGPIESIWLGNELSCQVKLVGDAGDAFFPDDTEPGDCGTFLTVGTDEYQPDFDNHDGSAFSTGTGMTSVPYTPVSQSAITGTGSAGNPFTVTTVVDAGTSGLRLTQVDSYVTGNKFYETQVTVSNSGEASQDAELYHAGDCFLAGSDSGFGFEIPSTGSIFCSENANNTPAGRLIGFQPQSPGSTYLEDDFDVIWDEIDSGLFSNTCAKCDTDTDNGIGLSWAITIPAGGSVTRSLITSIDPSGDVDPPETTITSGPAEGSTSNDSTPTFEFTSDEPGSTFECSVDGGPFTPCASGDTFGPLADGAHNFRVRATDPSGNTDPTPAERNFTVDAEGPPPPPPPPPPPTGATCRGEKATIAGTAAGEQINGTPGDDVIAAGAGNDTVDGQGGDDLICGEDGDDNIAGAAGDDDVYGQAGNDDLGGNTGGDLLVGGDGDDSASGGIANDTIGGGLGNDDLGGGAGNDNVGGGAGDDSVGGQIGNDEVGGGAGDDNLAGNAGNDDIGGNTGDDIIGGGIGNDRATGGGGADTVNGKVGNDLLGGGTGNDDLAGSVGNDVLVGGPADDTLSGGIGDDTLNGGPGTDSCNGGPGTNTVGADCE